MKWLEQLSESCASSGMKLRKVAGEAILAVNDLSFGRLSPIFASFSSSNFIQSIESDSIEGTFRLKITILSGATYANVARFSSNPLRSDSFSQRSVPPPMATSSSVLRVVFMKQISLSMNPASLLLPGIRRTFSRGHICWKTSSVFTYCMSVKHRFSSDSSWKSTVFTVWK
uniref:(northern house mosquito) hypothetical protein n=1 Tax=Culex pipiens TaxID=7175 RepID=A0A8D8A7F8_CULPI